MALVAVLALIVILTIIVVAFVSQARVEVAASSSFSSGVTTDALAKDAVNNIISSLRYEMEVGSTVAKTNGVAIYTPLTPQDILPKLDASIPVGATTNVPNLIRTSQAGALFNGATANSPASAVTTDKASLEGRKISLNRWNDSRLLTDAQNTSLATPAWIYVERQGPVALTAWSSVLSQPFVSGALNPQYVLGRYAYRIYDISGLLDVNVAGYPGLNAPPIERIGRKGGLAWADLANASFSGWTPAPTQTSDMINWRWPMADYADYVDGEGASSGFLLMPGGALGANRFLSRADLLKYLQSGTGGQFSNQGKDFAPQITMFSREVNAPSWKPDSAPLQSPPEMNPFIPSVRVVSGFTRRNGKTAAPGEPLVADRFPLSKIALFDEPDSNAAAIADYFGLASNGDGTWRYTAGTVSNTAGFTDGLGARERLKTLSEIATENREPNFFELLQAGIAADSLGQGALSSNHGFDNSWADKNIARHVLQIGLNVIDQYDADNDPTVIRRTPLASLTASQLDFDLSGVENVPYVQTIGYSVIRKLDSTSGTGADGYPIFPTVRGYYQFQLWNPHRNAGNAPASSYRIVGSGSPYYELETRTGSIVQSTTRTLDPSSDQLEFSTSSLNFAEPRLLGYNDVSATNLNDKYLGTSTYGTANIAGFWMGDLTANYTRLKAATPPNFTSSEELYGNNSSSSQVYFYHGSGDSTRFQLQKLDSGGNWRPVQTLALSNLSRYKFGETWYAATGGNPSAASESILFHKSPPRLRYHYAFSDPRTSRFGNQFFSRGDQVVNQSFPENNAYNFAGWLGPNAGTPSAPTDNNYGPSVGKLYSNTLPTFSYTERGGAVRRISDLAVANASAPTSPYAAGSASRPAMLNRPFKNVSEMGYAFRDLPWRSINFAQDIANPNAEAPADSALLDLFAVAEEPPIRAGVINLNTASKAAIKALLLGTNLNHPASTDAQLTDSEAESAAAAIYTYLGEGKRLKSGTDPIMATPGDVGRMVQALSVSGKEFAGWTKTKKEAIVMALAQVHNARTWNLFIDVIAQTGKFPSGSSGTLERFSVAGEMRLFVHLAIDRITGEVVEQFVEPAVEN